MSDVVVGYDGSDCAKLALDEALRIAESLGDRLVVVFGYAPPGIWGGEIAEHMEAIEEHGQSVLEEAKGRVASSDVPIEVLTIARKPAEALVELADEREARMIVVGTHGDAPLKGVILGSTPTKLLHAADRPVLVVPAGRS